MPLAALAAWGLYLALEAAQGSSRLVPVDGWDALEAAPVALALFAVGGVIAFQRRRPFEAFVLFSSSYLLRVLLMILLTPVFQFDDELSFHQSGVEEPYGLFGFGAGRLSYYLFSLLYRAFGPNILIPKLVITLLGSLLPFLVYDLAMELFDSRTIAVRAALFTAFLPPLLIFSTTALKEVPTAFMLTLFIWALARETTPSRRALWLVVSVGLLYWYRDPWLAFCAVPFIALVPARDSGHTVVKLARSVGRWRLSKKRMALAAVAAAAAWPLVVRPVLDRAYALAGATYFATNFRDSTAVVNRFADLSAPLSPKNVGLFLIRGLFSPPPIRFVADPGISTVLEGSITLVWYVVAPMALIGVLAWRDRRPVIMCGLLAGAVIAAGAGAVMLGSDPFRHRIPDFPLLFVFAAAGLEQPRSRLTRFVYRGWWWAAILFIALWAVFRF